MVTADLCNHTKSVNELLKVHRVRSPSEFNTFHYKNNCQIQQCEKLPSADESLHFFSSNTIKKKGDIAIS